MLLFPPMIPLLAILLLVFNLLVCLGANVDPLIFSQLGLNVISLLQALLIYASAFFCGRIFLKKFGFSVSKVLDAPLSFLLGLEVHVLLIYSLGFLGVFGIYRIFVVGTSLFFLKDLYLQSKLNGLSSERSVTVFQLSPSAWPVLGFCLLLLFLCFNPHSGYDALEYHLAIPFRYLTEGRIVPFPGNMYSNFPLGAEMLNLGGLLMGSDSIPKLLLIGQLFLLLTLIGGFLKDLEVPPLIQSLILLLIASHDVVLKQLILSDIDLYVTFACSVYFLHLYYSDFERKRDFILSGILAGVLAGYKYLAFPLFLLPGFLFLLFKTRRLSGVMLSGVSALLIFAPWLIKNNAFTGDPLAPFFWNILGTEKWTGAHYHMFRAMHSPGSSEFIARIRENFVEMDGAFLFLGLWIYSFREAKLKMMGPFLWMSLLLWAFLMKDHARFIFPVFPLLACYSGRILSLLNSPGLWKVCVLLLSATVFANVLYVSILISGEIPFAIGYYKPIERLLNLSDPFFKGREWLNSNLGPGDKVLFIGEARTYGFHFLPDMATVCDENPLERYLKEANSLEDLKVKLGEGGYRYLFVNRAELKRLQDAYGYLFPALAGFYFEKGSKEETLFLKLMEEVFGNNLMPEENSKWLSLYKLYRKP